MILNLTGMLPETKEFEKQEEDPFKDGLSVREELFDRNEQWDNRNGDSRNNYKENYKETMEKE